MSDDRARILELLATGKITAEEAARLLDALEAPAETAGRRGESAVEAASPGPPPKNIYVKVLSTAGDNVNVKMPIGLVRAGLKLTSFIPQPAMEQISKAMMDHGLSADLLNFKAGDLERLIPGLARDGDRCRRGQRGQGGLCTRRRVAAKRDAPASWRFRARFQRLYTSRGCPACQLSTGSRVYGTRLTVPSPIIAFSSLRSACS